MTVGDIITDALASEINTQSLADKKVADRDRIIISFINQAIVEIAKEITIKQEEKVYELLTDVDFIAGSVNEYYLPSNFLRPVSVWGENGYELPLNDTSSIYSVYIPDFSKIVIPYGEAGTYVSLIYSARPDRLAQIYDGETYDESATIAQTLPITDAFEQAILAYIALKARAPQGSDMQSENNVYYMRFKAEMQKLINTGMDNADPINNTNFYNLGGWNG